jgi:hypothetical protein
MPILEPTIQKNQESASAPHPYNPDINSLTPLQNTYQLQLHKVLLEARFTMRFSHLRSINFFLDPTLPDNIIVQVLLSTMGKGNDERWLILDDKFLKEDSSLGYRQHRDKLLQYYPDKNIKAPSINLAHSRYLQEHPIYEKRFAMLTAWNPNNKSANEVANYVTNKKLRQAIVMLGYEPIECVGSVGEHSEDGFVIQDILFDEALQLGRQFGQYSIFYNDCGRWGYYESEHGYPIYFTAKKYQESLRYDYERDAAIKKNKEKHTLEKAQWYKEKIAHPISFKRKINYIDLSSEEEIDELIERITDGGYGIGAMMGRQGVSREVIMENVRLFNERKLKSQGFDSYNEKLICLMLRSHKIASPKLKTKILLELFTTHTERDDAFDVMLYDVFQSIYGVFDGTNIPAAAFETLYLLQKIFG